MKAKKALLFMLLLLGCFHFSVAQTLLVRGTVTDESKIPLSGVGVVVKNTTRGVSTDFDGKFEIQAKAGDVLEFTSLGFITQERTVKGIQNQTINIVLKEDTQQLKEVVVVGFGSQKKENLTGSVASVDAKVLEARPVNSAVQALQGAVSGMNFNVGRGGGELDNNLAFNIRGAGTIGSGSTAKPLILIDGMEGDLNALNPQDIESISILKDAASSSIYGSRAPFGVVLVTTKSGREGRVVINYSNNFRFSNPTNIPRMLDSESFAYYWNDADLNSGSEPTFTPDIIEKIKLYKEGKLTEATDWNDENGDWNKGAKSWANVDWFKEAYREWAPATEHNFSVRGGTEKTNYYVSAGLLNQEGLFRYNTDTFDRYTFNAKLSSQILPYLRLNYNGRFTRTGYERSSFLIGYDGLFFHNIGRKWPTLPKYDPNGHYIYNNDLANFENGRAKDRNDIMVQQLAFVFTPIKDWVTNVELNYSLDNEHSHIPWLPIYRYDKEGRPIPAALIEGYFNNPGASRIYESTKTTDFYNVNVYTSYQKEINGHFLKGMVGFQSELQKTRFLSASREGVYSTDVLAIDATGSENDNVGGNYQHWATAGLFGRINYDYKGKYLFEGNIRYDGTSRFLKDQRWNTFVSASAGWNIAKENFWASLGEFGRKVSEFKLKASYGELGNQNTDNWYPFYSKMKLRPSAGSWFLNGQKPNVAYAPDLISTSLTWEKVASWNAGIDVSAFQNRLNLSFELFKRTTYNMVGPAPQLPPTLGIKPPQINNTDMESKGFDAQISWRDRIGEDFSYGITFNLTDSRQKITKYPNEIGSLSAPYYAGKYIGEIWGYTTRGIAKTDEEMANWVKDHNQNRLGSDWRAGDIMYENLDDKDEISNGANTLTDHGDLRIIGNSTPRYNYGLMLDFKYKNIDFSLFLQGTAKRDYYINTPHFRGANGPNSYYKAQAHAFPEHLDYFRPEGTNHPLGANVDSYYPRPSFTRGSKNFHTQTRWLQDASYLRVKNIQMGYTFSPDIMNTIGVDKLRIFVSVENAFTFTKLAKMFDPEALEARLGGTGKVYPLSRVISTGLSITF
ncbi:SusC/RagA family TonB-linked outer membrane protein [Capnocytophaga stomatis]|uniref:SusC/RagA family TonB-linked outer membrane protein n=1 Tax=Capnocytophaga stomatis TaxID=1848904 RepID=UPI0019521B89|nr:TonB-dependent receptor [Capnocytophaga stomatis]GIJ97198.1 SusC/RagA family TonB-linked outer membrane protein [Capnocytophaga stomatis]